jgi:2-phospho-L-lactate/phosphoenolpyruvate guanylyltransferase
LSVWALVPAKSFARGKSRLGPVLEDDARAAFARSLFDHVLATLTASGAVDGVLVATNSSDVAAAAHAHGAEVLDDAPGAVGLAAVVDDGLAALAARGARTALVLMADLPRLTADDVRTLAAAAAAHDVVIVRADDGCHTNALALSPPACLRTAFGRADSFDAHGAAARAAGLRLAVVDNARIAFDVDGPEDHARLIAAGARPRLTSA